MGDRVNVYVPRFGYFAVGITLGEAKRFDQAEVNVDGGWVPLAEQQLNAPYMHDAPDAPVTDDNAAYVVPVRWLTSYSRDQACWEKCMFANQNSACKLRQKFTLDRLSQHFELNRYESGE